MKTVLLLLAVCMFAPPVELDARGHKVEYAGFGWSAPRTGTPLSDVAEVVYPSGQGCEVIYFRLRLRTPGPIAGSQAQSQKGQ